jgi:predicted DNA-binding transcriptional regulator YafY
MAKRDHFLRYIGIINKLRNQGDASFEEICNYLEMQADIRDFNPDISKRTFQRDLEEILSLFNIEIRYDFSRRVYYIVEEEELKDMNNRLLEAFDILNLCNAVERVSPYVIFENRRPQGTHHFNGLLHAIENRKVVVFRYKKYYGDHEEGRNADPYALKESRERWYLVAKDHKDQVVKTFALDRLSGLEITNRKFAFPAHYDPNEKFRHCFGVLGDENSQPQEIILSIEPFQGKYVKSFPLHVSQQILADNDKELRVRLFLYITTDLIMELMSLGDTLKVISPARLKNALCRNYQNALKSYAHPKKS